MNVRSAESNDPSETSRSAGPVAAGTVRITRPVDGSCAGGPGPARGGFGGAFGEVTAVTGAGFTVEGLVRRSVGSGQVSS